MIKQRKAAEAAFAKSWRKKSLNRDFIVGGARGPDRAVEGKVPNEPNAEWERVNARGRGRDGVESSSIRGTRWDRSMAAAREGVVSVYSASVSYSSMGTALTEVVEVVERAGEG